MEFETSKNLGLIGAILLVIGNTIFLSAYVGFLSVVGGILVLISLYGFSKYYSEGGIFKNTIYAIILVIVGLVVTAASVLVTAVGFLLQLGLDVYDVSTWSVAQLNLENLTDLTILLPFIGAIIIAVIIFVIFAILAAIFFRKSMRLLSEKTGVGMFATTGLIMLIGTILAIVVVGFLLIWIAWILLAIAFYRIKKTSTPPVQTKT